MKRKIIAVSLIVAIAIFGIVAVPVFAADPAGSAPATEQGANWFGRGCLLGKLLLIQDEARVDSLLAAAVTNGKLTTEQSDKIKTFWTERHGPFSKKVVLRGLIKIQDEARLQEILNQGITNGKITQDQANQIIAAWERIHKK
jgi:polyhydroxyalkanoate synthesis regulator phasin